ncbi:class I SAM-dependent methyltransferase [Rhizobium skierniewicense]|uniref:class I SAM-dependent methyltransferase n=1 Tax=Rhizobium skierniewicense TaxID=984260 RepID=UPI0015719F12|nr:class I SAM-dependent methyltransferase [Rhizobium skierniewicense]NTF33468.1 class I SAM-dependent methyltransferase [Rhizobium skierniewicense]
MVSITQSDVPATILPIGEILTGYDAVANLYPYIPPLSHWRAWEFAAYQHHRIDGRILDVGCGDGRYFKLIWPNADNVVGVDMDSDVAERGRQSGVYRAVHTTKADSIPERANSFDSAFANCSLEHMDNISGVLGEISRCLKPGGSLSCSVVTNRLIEWSLLPSMVSEAGFNEAASQLQADFLEYHHLENPLRVDVWTEEFNKAGLIVESHIPILPRYSSGLFVLMDTLWHVKRKTGGEFGDLIYPLLSSNPQFPSAFRKVVEGLLEMEQDWTDCTGAVFSVRKPTI